jgi:hypothetical protein
VFEEIFLGCFAAASRVLQDFLGGGRGGRGVVWFQEGIVQTVMQAIKLERVSVHETKWDLSLLESLCTSTSSAREVARYPTGIPDCSRAC